MPSHGCAAPSTGFASRAHRYEAAASSTASTTITAQATNAAVRAGPPSAARQAANRSGRKHQPGAAIIATPPVTPWDNERIRCDRSSRAICRANETSTSATSSPTTPAAHVSCG